MLHLLKAWGYIGALIGTRLAQSIIGKQHLLKFMLSQSLATFPSPPFPAGTTLIGPNKI